MNNYKCPLCNNKEYFTKSEYPHPNHSNELGYTEIVKCQNCELSIAHPVVDQDALDQYYSDDRYWTEINKSLLDFFQYQSIERIKRVANYLSPNESKPLHFLDIGAGLGTTETAISYLYTDFQYYFIEPDNNLATRISNKKRTHRLSNINQAKVKFDVIFANHVIEHMANPVEFIQRLKPLLKREGIIYIEVPNEDHKFKEDVFPHCVFFNKSSLERTIKNCDLKLLACKPFGEKSRILSPTRYQHLKIRLCSFIKNEKLKMILYNSRYRLGREDRDGVWLYAISKN